MRCYLITYDLSGKRDYSSLIEAVKEYKTWAHVTESTWAVVTDKSAQAIRDHLLSLMHEDDRLLVVKSGTEAAWNNVLCRNEWLKKNL
jgi:hypothetical protein